MVLIYILGTLLITLLILIPLLEKFGPRISNEETSKYARFLFPLIAIIMIIQLLIYIFK